EEGPRRRRLIAQRRPLSVVAWTHIVALGAGSPIGVEPPGTPMWVQRAFPVAARKIRAVAQMLLITWMMRSTNAAPTNPWGTSIDDAWKDLVVSSAPPPPVPRDGAEPVV